MKRKFLCFILLIIVISLVSILAYANFFYTKEEQKKKPDNKSEDVVKKEFNEEHYYEKLVIKELNLEKHEEYTTLTLLIYNDSDEDVYDYSLKIFFTDKNNKEIANISIDVGDISKGESKMFSEEITIDCIDSYDYHFEKN